jgi:hypothetical protein
MVQNLSIDEMFAIQKSFLLLGFIEYTQQRIDYFGSESNAHEVL